METTDYASYELAIKLKECGFDSVCRYYYTKRYSDNAVVCLSSKESPTDYNKMPGAVCSMPTLWQAQKWLREKKGIVVIAEPDWDSENYCMADYLTGEWYFSVWKDGDRVHCNFDPNAEEERIWMFEKYEQALSAGISAALELIKKGE